MRLRLGRAIDGPWKAGPAPVRGLTDRDMKLGRNSASKATYAFHTDRNLTWHQYFDLKTGLSEREEGREGQFWRKRVVTTVGSGLVELSLDALGSFLLIPCALSPACVFLLLRVMPTTVFRGLSKDFRSCFCRMPEVSESLQTPQEDLSILTPARLWKLSSQAFSGTNTKV